MYCIQCGAYLSRRHLRFCPYCSVAFENAKRQFCPECGTARADDAPHSCLAAALAPGNLPPALWMQFLATLLFFPFGALSLVMTFLSHHSRRTAEPERADAFARYSRVFLFLSLLAFFLVFLLTLLRYAIFRENN